MALIIYCAAMNNPLPPNMIIAHADGGRLLRNLTFFAALLRQAGIGGGIQKTAAAAAALSHTGVEKRADVFWALAAVFVERHEQLPLFRQAFNLFWRGDKTQDAPPTEDNDSPFAAPLQQHAVSTPLSPNDIAADKTHSAADFEQLAKKDFARMNKEEWRAAMRINQTLAAALPPPPSRRKQSAARGKLDMKRTVRRAFSRDGDVSEYYRRRNGKKPPRLIVLVDISGSMSVYSRAFLHFIAGMFVGGKTKTHAFLLGTRLTSLRPPRGGDVDNIADRIAAAAQDWDGGTRLTPLLREFNCRRLRRLGAGEAVVLFATDGLEVNFNESAFAAEISRLQKSCRRFIWLNPLLRYAQYEPLARGAKILSRHADETYSIHNIDAAAQLTRLLSAPKTPPRTRHLRTHAPKLSSPMHSPNAVCHRPLSR